MFRVVTYNIRAGLGTDGKRSIRRIAEILASLSPDVVCLQEVDQHVPRSWLANQPKYLSTRLGMQVVFQKNLQFSGGAFGNAILAKPGVRDCHCHPLPGSGEPRGLLQTIVPIDGGNTHIFCTHLSTERDVRVAQASAVSEILRQVKEPKVLCGDMNDVMGSQTLAAILDDRALVDSAVELDTGDIPTCDDTRRIDFVLPDLHFRVVSYQVIASDASDHRPVAVDLQRA